VGDWCKAPSPASNVLPVPGGPYSITPFTQGLTQVHFPDCVIIVYPPTITCTSGLTRVHFSDCLIIVYPPLLPAPCYTPRALHESTFQLNLSHIVEFCH